MFVKLADDAHGRWPKAKEIKGAIAHLQAIMAAHQFDAAELATLDFAAQGLAEHLCAACGCETERECGCQAG